MKGRVVNMKREWVDGGGGGGGYGVGYLLGWGKMGPSPAHKMPQNLKPQLSHLHFYFPSLLAAHN